MLQWARRQNNVLPLFVGLIGVSTAYAISFLSIPGSLIACIVSFFLVYLELITQWSFRAPPRRKPEVNDPAWTKLSVEVNGMNIVHYLHEGRPNAPLAWIIHGWTSGSMRMLQRAESFVERGWNVLLVDLPSHGGSDSLTKWSAEESTTLLIHSINQLHREQPTYFEHGVCYFGHSIGSFIGLRLSKRRDELQIGENLRGWIFESPMTGYTEIHEETCNILRIPRILRPWILAKTIRHFNALNGPERIINNLSEADVPSWGITTEPTLLVQADPDERLGPGHHERLVLAMKERPFNELLQSHFLPDLRHSGSHESASRKNVVDAWLDEQFPYSSSV